MGMLKMNDATAVRFGVFVPLSKRDHFSSRGTFFYHIVLLPWQSHTVLIIEVIQIGR